ncbi:MAG: hypothetical protein QMD03_10065 [Syntrophales bacterium]|nr:hypothetical protein [Syntrophales bacterium]
MFCEIAINHRGMEKRKLVFGKDTRVGFYLTGYDTGGSKKNLLEVVKIQFTEMKEMGTLEDYLLECGFETKDNDIMPQTEMVGFEKSVVSV